MSGVPVYLRDIAEVKDSTEDFRSFTRINGKPGVRLRITKQSGQNTVQIADAVRVEVAKINREVPGITLTVLDDSSIFIKRSITAVQEHALLGGALVMLIIFVFLRDIRATFIVFTSIPISVIGTFALLYFNGYTLNTMTFGGLALGIGMIVDASIVVIENTFRHMEHGKDRMLAAIEGSEEVWSAILASTLDAHRGLRSAPVPDRRVEHPLQAALGRRDVLADDVALCRGHDRSGALLADVEAAGARRAAPRRRRTPLHVERTVLRRHGQRLQPADPQVARAPADGLGDRRGGGRRRCPHPADDRLRTDAAGGRGRSQRDGGTAGRHADRARAGCRDAARDHDAGARARSRDGHHAGGRRRASWVAAPTGPT